MSALEGQAGATPANPERLRERLADLLGIDRWIEAAFPAVAPTSRDDVVKLMQGYPGEVMVIGTGSSFPPEFSPPTDALIVLTSRLTEALVHSVEDQILEVSAGWPVKDVRKRLAAAGAVIPALERFEAGTVGGRLGAISSRHSGGLDGWTQSLLGLVVVLPDGEVLELGGRCIKDVAGYDLRHLFTGSRGSAGLILQATFRCRPASEWANSGISGSIPNNSGRFSPVLRKLFDPKGRMRPGV